jgi:glycosyltransferase involved in cell wall biosynthesis
VPYEFTDIKTYDFQKDFDAYDVIFALWLSDEMISYAKSKNKLLVFDLYAPVPVENLVGYIFSHSKPLPENDYNYEVSLNNYKNFLSVGDFFVCSNEVQKDFWTGLAFGSGGLTPSSYVDFPVYDRIGISPMGINLAELASAGKKNPLLERIPQLKSSDKVIVWTGGIWDWFDVETPLKAMKQLYDEGITDIKLVFLGTRHPNSDVPEMGETEKAFSLAREWGLFNETVFFLEGWIEYSKRLDYLLAASVALYAHKPSIEARFSHRTRVLDHILTCLPTIATEGDYFADLIDIKQLGISVPTGDSAAMADAIKTVREPKTLMKFKKNIAEVQSEFTWNSTLHPLVEFIRSDVSARKIARPTVKAQNKSGIRIPRRVTRRIPRPVKEAVKRQIVKRKQQ